MEVTFPYPEVPSDRLKHNKIILLLKKMTLGPLGVQCVLQDERPGPSKAT